MNDKLLNSTMKFKLACLNKLTEKEKAGWTGWDNQDAENGFKNELKVHYDRKDWTQDDLIDISNYCMFLWNLIEVKIKEEKVNV